MPAIPGKHEPIAYLAKAGLDSLIYFGAAMGERIALVTVTRTVVPRSLRRSASWTERTCHNLWLRERPGLALDNFHANDGRAPYRRFVTGVGHVLTGPDHLSALALLSVGTTFRAFVLGVRWGVGHRYGSGN